MHKLKLSNMDMLKLCDKIKASFSFKLGNKAIAKNGSNATAGDQSPIIINPITNNTYHNVNYIELLEEKLGDSQKIGELDIKAFNRLEQLYESAKTQQPKHTTIETFRLIAVEYYTQKIKDAKEKGEDPFAYERALARYSK